MFWWHPSFWNMSKIPLKVVSATFLLVCFVSLKEGTCIEKSFLFYFKSSRHSWDNQILTFQLSNIMTSSNAQAWSTKHILTSLCNITKEKFLSKNSMKNMAWKLIPALFSFQRNLCKKENEEVCKLILVSFVNSAITHLM